MPHCFVPGCTSRTRGRLDSGKVKRRFYSAPVKNKELLEKWRISIGRKDLELDSKARICDLHFAEDLLQKYDEFIINGEQVSFPRTNWRLKPDAVPTIFHVGKLLLITNLQDSTYLQVLLDIILALENILVVEMANTEILTTDSFVFGSTRK